MLAKTGALPYCTSVLVYKTMVYPADCG